MQSHNRRPWFLSGCIVISIFLSLVGWCEPAPKNSPREQIGTVLGNPIFRDQLPGGGSEGLEDEVKQVFLAPVMQQYCASHVSEVTPSTAEMKTVTDSFMEKHQDLMKKEGSKMRARLKEIESLLANKDFGNKPTDDGSPTVRQDLEYEQIRLEADLDPPDPRMADFMVRPWKLQKHLYEKFGGGRILWQQNGVEAFDAMRTWIENQEKLGNFTITDPKLRTLFYEYWTTKNHGHFLSNDQEKIRDSLLAPTWFKPEP